MRSYLLATVLLTATFLGGCTAAVQRTAPGGINDLQMVSVEGGCFPMGDMFGVGRGDERPVHKVCVDGFRLGKYEVTQAQWTEVMGKNPSSFNECGPECPVENVSWQDAQRFIERLNEKTGKKYRLPTEAEWEYAGRSGGKNEKWSGFSHAGQIGEFAWFNENSDEKTHPVGMKMPNGLGIYDMTGNVWEWCGDLHGESYYKQSPEKNPVGPTVGQYRVTRGGSWGSSPWEIRVSARGRILEKRTLPGVGLRLALPAAQ